MVTWTGLLVELRYLCRPSAGRQLERVPEPRFWRAWKSLELALAIECLDVQVSALAADTLADPGPVDSCVIELARQLVDSTTRILTIDQHVALTALALGVPPLEV